MDLILKNLNFQSLLAVYPFFFSLEILVGNGKPTFLFIFEHNISAISAAALCIRIKWPPHFMNISWLFAVFVHIFVYRSRTQRVNKNDFADSYIYNVDIGTLLYVYNGNTVLNGSWRVRLTGVMVFRCSACLYIYIYILYIYKIFGCVCVCVNMYICIIVCIHIYHSSYIFS